MWIPAIDLSAGQSVRLYQGDFDQKTLINRNPLDQAMAIQQAGLTRLHLVDLDGAKAGNPQNLSAIKQLVEKTNLLIELGGGIRTAEQIKRYLELGIDRVIIGSAAVNDPGLVSDSIRQYGSDKIVIGVDGKEGIVATQGWLDTETISVAELIERMIKLGAQYFIVTDISRDGTMQGPNVEQLVELKARYPSIELIASGGIRNITDLQTLLASGISSAVIGKALSNGGLALEQLKKVN